MQLHWLFLSLYNQMQFGCNRMSFTHSVAAFFALVPKNSDSIRWDGVAVVVSTKLCFVHFQESEVFHTPNHFFVESKDHGVFVGLL